MTLQDCNRHTAAVTHPFGTRAACWQVLQMLPRPPHLDGLDKQRQHVHCIDQVWRLNLHGCQLGLQVHLHAPDVLHGLHTHGKQVRSSAGMFRDGLRLLWLLLSCGCCLNSMWRPTATCACTDTQASQMPSARTLSVASTFELQPPHFIPSTLTSSSTVLAGETATATWVTHKASASLASGWLLDLGIYSCRAYHSIQNSLSPAAATTSLGNPAAVVEITRDANGLATQGLLRSCRLPLCAVLSTLHPAVCSEHTPRLAAAEVAAAVALLSSIMLLCCSQEKENQHTQAAKTPESRVAGLWDPWVEGVEVEGTVT